jgi:hypothetical protein
MNPVDRQLLLSMMRDRASSGLLVRLSWFVAPAHWGRWCLTTRSASRCSAKS